VTGGTPKKKGEEKEKNTSCMKKASHWGDRRPQRSQWYSGLKPKKKNVNKMSQNVNKMSNTTKNVTKKKTPSR